ncbi:MAG TPA: transporter [Gemmatimonadaceae bacterium]|nr:transporter [Gemmatimonadaceae bacterium]
MSRHFLPLILIATAATAVRAQTDSAPNPRAVQPERPTVATHAGTVWPGYIELEEGAEWDRWGNGERSFFAPTNLKIGLTSHAQLNLLVNIIHDPRLAGRSINLGDFAVGVKYRILDEHPLLGDFAILPAIKFPTATRNAGTGTTDFSLLFISSYHFGPVAMDLNAGATRRTGNGSSAPRMATIWTASFGFPISGPVGWTAEVFGFPRTSGPAGSEGTAAVLLGPTLLVRDWLSLDAGFITPLTGPLPHAIYAGFVWNFGRL